MKPLTTPKSRRSTTAFTSVRLCSDEIANRAAAVRREWSAAERQLRAGLAEQLQRGLFAVLATALVPAPVIR